MRKLARVAATIAIGLTSLAANAARNDIPDCYTYANLTKFKPADSQRELVIAVDETTSLSEDLQKESLSHVLRFLKEGDRVLIYKFSAYTQDSHNELLFAGNWQSHPDQSVQDDLPSGDNNKLNACLAQQKNFFQVQIAKAMKIGFGSPSHQIARSDILMSLKQISNELKDEERSNKKLFLISDMLENSDVTSFYQNNMIKQIDPAAEMKKTESADLLASLRGIDTYVMGAGFIQHNAKYGYRSTKLVQSLQSYWENYFSSSGSKLRAFGAPSMGQEIQ